MFFLFVASPVHAGFSVQSVDYVPFAKAAQSYNLAFQNLWLVHGQVTPYESDYLATLISKDKKHASYDKVLISAQIKDPKCMMQLQKNDAVRYYYYGYQVFEAGLTTPDNLYSFCVNKGLNNIVYAYAQRGYEGDYLHVYVICVYRSHNYYAEAVPMNVQPVYTIQVNVKDIDKGQQTTLTLSRYANQYVAKNNLIAIRWNNDIKRTDVPYYCGAMKYFKYAYTPQDTIVIYDPDKLQQWESQVANMVSTLRSYSSINEIIDYINAVNHMLTSAMCTNYCHAPGLPPGVYVTTENLNGKTVVMSSELPYPLYIADVNLYINAQWVGVVLPVAIPHIEKVVPKVFNIPSGGRQLLKVYVANKNKAFSGTVTLSLVGCKDLYMEGPVTVSVPSDGTAVVPVDVIAGSRIYTKETQSCYLQATSANGEYTDKYKLVYTILPYCVDKCTPGSAKCVDKYHILVCKKQPNGCYDWTEMVCPSGAECIQTSRNRATCSITASSGKTGALPGSKVYPTATSYVQKGESLLVWVAVIMAIFATICAFLYSKLTGKMSLFDVFVEGFIYLIMIYVVYNYIATNTMIAVATFILGMGFIFHNLFEYFPHIQKAYRR